jgi:hypothetical protein
VDDELAKMKAELGTGSAEPPKEIESSTEEKQGTSS